MIQQTIEQSLHGGNARPGFEADGSIIEKLRTRRGQVWQDESPQPDEPLRLLPQPLIEPEPRWKRWLYALLAAALVAGFLYFTQSFWSPAHPGVDQNGYLVGGKMLAEHFTPGQKPQEPYAFVGWMWVRTEDGWYYPKYPIGLPLLNAIALWLDPLPGDPNGKLWVMRISPICTAAALVATFLTVRLVAGSFLGLLGMILLGTSMTTLAVTNSPWSHGPALGFVTWGMYLLLRWWQTGSIRRGLAAGFLLGYAVTIRYTEGLLILPLGLVLVTMVRWRRPRSYLRAAVPLLAWLGPVVALVAFNKLAMGTWTGYDPTNESTGFTRANFLDKWEFMVQQIYDYGMFFVAPLAVLGFVMLYRGNWKLGLYFTLWFVPGVLLYTAYYWGLQRGGIGYLRFFLTLFPPMIVAACWLMYAAWPGRSVAGQSSGAGIERWRWSGSVAAPIGCGVIVAIAAAVGVRNALPGLTREHGNNLRLAYTMDQIISTIPSGSVVFVQQSGGGGGMGQLLNFLQFKGDYELYAADAFSTRGLGWRGGLRPGEDDDAPHPLQPARRRFLQEQVYAGKSERDLVREQNRIASQALSGERRVFVITPTSVRRSFESRFIRDSGLQLHPVANWKELAIVPATELLPTPLQPQPRMPVPTAPGAPGAPGRPGAPPGVPPGPSPARSSAPQTWQILEITAAAPAPSPPPSTPTPHR